VGTGTTAWESAEMRALLDMLFAPSAIGISFHDPALRFVYVNAALAALGGRPAAAYLGRTFDEMLPAIATDVVPYLRRVLESNAPLLDRHFHRGDRHWLVSYYPVRTPAGDVLGVGAVVRDETARHQTARLLRESEARYRALVDMCPDAIVSIDDERITFANQAAIALIGAAGPAEAVGLRVWDLVHPDDAAAAKARFAEGLARRTHIPFTARVVRLDGAQIVVDVRAAVYDSSGRPALQAVIRDVTEERAAERERERLHRELTMERELLGTVLRHLPAGVLVVDAVSGLLVLANDEAERIWGSAFDRQTLPVGTPPTPALLAAAHVRPRAMAMLEAISTGKATRDLEADVVCGDGIVRSLRGSATPVAGPDGRIVAAVATFVDVGDEKQARDELRRARDELEQRVAERTARLAEAYGSLQHEVAEREQAERQLRVAERLASIGTFTAGVAHEINNPLAAILATAELARALNREAAPAEVDAALERIVAEARRGGEIVKGLLRFARAERAERWPLDLNDVVRRMCDAPAPQAPPGPPRLDVRLARRLPPVTANPTEVAQVLVNLLQNAAQAGATRVVVRTHAAVGRVTLEVRDDGRGIAPADLDRIFDPFFTTRQLDGGTGLGLSVVHGIVQRYDGAVRVRSRPGRGTTFTVVLPASEAAPDRTATMG
jgi:PAS domain S-box-containing protein